MIEAPTNDDPDAAENVGVVQVELQRPAPPPCGLAPFAGWRVDANFSAAVAEAQQQAASAPAPSAAKKKDEATEGFQDAGFKVQTKVQSGRIETNGKVIYISGLAPSAASSSSKVDSWSRIKNMRMAGEGALEAGAQLHLRPDHLDDGWLLSALAMLYAKPELISQLHTHDPNLGVHAVRLFKDGEAKGVAAEWGTVVVDDQLPCHGKKKPIFSTNVDPGGGPVAAVSKALAKLYGCYEHLNGGRVGSALEDLTGGISDKIYLRDAIAGADGVEKQPRISCATECAGGVSGAMWARLKEILDGGHLLGAAYKPKYAAAGGGGDVVAMPPKSDAVKRALVYPLVEMKEVDGSGYVRLKNCWGKVGEGKDNSAPEYKGDWGASSASWQNDQGVAAALGGKPRDNTFWMSYEHFLAGFNKVYVCYLPYAPTATIINVEGEWTQATGGGRLSAAPGAKWRSNPQYRLTVREKCTVLISISQQDSQTDANDASDAYPNAIGFHLIGGPNLGERRTLSYSDGPLRSSRYANSRQVCRVLELDPSSDECVYNLMPATWEPNVFMPYTLTVCASAHVSVEAIPESNDYMVASAMGTWSATANTAGGCPNFPDTWTNNPQIRLTTSVGGSIGVGILSINLPEAELKKLQAEHEKLEQSNDVESMLSIGLVVLPIAEADTGKGAGDKPALQKRLTSVALAGKVAIDPEQIVAKSAMVMGAEEQATVLIDLPPGPGSYLVVPCTFYPGQECPFTLTIYHADPKLVLTPLKGVRLPPPDKQGKGKKQKGVKMGPPVSKHDVAATRAEVASEAKVKAGGGGEAAGAGGEAAAADELGDDGKMGYMQKMEIELAQKMSKSPENIPVFTMEGAPLSDNVKAEYQAKVQYALDQCARTGGKFEDSGEYVISYLETDEKDSKIKTPKEKREKGFPAAAGKAAGDYQPECYRYKADGVTRAGTMKNVRPIVDWCRPEDIAPDSPVMFRNDYSVEGIIQGSGFDNRWFVSALNICSGNRGQLDRVFFGELCDEWIDKGFFVCKFYQDDPLSDDDWQVVLIDDRIACTRDDDGRPFPVFARNPDPNVYWAMIIEKAYAKMVGSYEAMQGGTVTQGLEDFTGGIGYKFDLEKREKEWVPPKGSEPDKLWHELLEKMMTEHVVGCANNTKGQDRPQSTKKGILLNRAYAVVTAGEFEDYRLHKLRIPLNEDGSAKEWTGRWSDNSPQWNNRLRQMLSYSNDDADGTFWMEYKDLCRHFNKVYMCRMLDDLWTRITVKSRWMDETAGGCTNYISWRNNNQWLLTISRPNTKLVITLSQPDARKSSGNGRHFSNAIGFYILKGNEPNASKDNLRRKLIAKDGDADDYICEACDHVTEGPSTAGAVVTCDKCNKVVQSGDFVFCKEPRFSKKVMTEYTFEHASTTPYVLLPFMFEPGREQMFRFTILSDDRDDDGEPDFFFQWVRPHEDWKRLTLYDAFHKGGKGNALAKKHNAEWQANGATAGGPLEEKTWSKNCQFQMTLYEKTRVYLFVEARNVKTDMRDVEGLQTEPDYPTMGFYVCRGQGDHVLLGPDEKPEVLFTAPAKFGDGVYLELGALAAEQYVVIPFTSQSGVEHEYALTLYTDIECAFEKIDPTKLRKGCIACTDKRALGNVTKRLASLEAKYAEVNRLEASLKAAQKYGIPRPPTSLPPPPTNLPVAPAYESAVPPPHQPLQPPLHAAPPPHHGQQPQGEDAIDRMFAAADMDGDGYVSVEEMAAFKRYYQAVDKDKDGDITASELKRASEDIQRKGYEQQQALMQRQAALQTELAAGAEDLQAMMAAVEQARARQAGSRSVQPSARGRGGRKARAPAPVS